MICVELTGAIDAAGTERTFYLCDGRFVTKGSDTPANTAFDDSLIDPGSIGVTAFGDGRTGGATKLSFGEIVLANSDGQYDGWLNYGFDGRTITIRQGNHGAAYPSAFTTLFTGTVEALTVNRKQVVIRLRDRQFIFALPALPNRYAGTNSLPSGIEGTAADLKGQAKPRLYGRAFNIPAPCVNTSKLVFQISDGAIYSVDAVYDRGAGLTAGADVPNSAALLAATVSAGTYQTCLAEGLFRLGSSPAGQITADATQGGSAGTRTTGQLLSALAQAAGVAPGLISTSDVAALDAAAPYTVGIWVNDEMQFAEAMDQLAASAGAYYGFDAQGVLRMAQLTAPGGASVLSLAEDQILNAFERKPARDGDLPAWRLAVRHSKLWEVQGSDVASAVTAARRSYLAVEYRAEQASDATVKAKYLLAAEETVETLLTTAGDAATEANRRLAMVKVRRDFFDLDIAADQLGALKLMDAVTVTSSRFGMGAGRQFRLLGLNLQVRRNRATLTLWG